MAFFGSAAGMNKRKAARTTALLETEGAKLSGKTLEQLINERTALYDQNAGDEARRAEDKGAYTFGWTINNRLKAYDARIAELQAQVGGDGGPSLGGETPNPLADLQAAYAAAGAAGVRGRKRAAAGSRRSLVNGPEAATATYKPRTLLGR